MDPSSKKSNSSFTPLQQHVVRFSNPFWRYNATTVSDGLQTVHGNMPWLKGTIIAGFNATHSGQGVCPKMNGHFVQGDDGTFGHHLHLGTTRIWRPDGSIDESRWTAFVTYVTMDQQAREEKVVFKSVLKNYLNYCLQVDQPEANTGRHAEGWGSSESVQVTAATAAWDEVYERLTCGWEKNDKEAWDPYITLALVRQFFEDSEKAFEAAERQELPVVKPNDTVERALRVT